MAAQAFHLFCSPSPSVVNLPAAEMMGRGPDGGHGAQAREPAAAMDVRVPDGAAVDAAEEVRARR